jgi:hypothetical protein
VRPAHRRNQHNIEAMCNTTLFYFGCRILWIVWVLHLHELEILFLMLSFLGSISFAGPKTVINISQETTNLLFLSCFGERFTIWWQYLASKRANPVWTCFSTMLDSRRASCENLLHILIIIYLGNSIPQSSNHKSYTWGYVRYNRWNEQYNMAARSEYIYTNSNTYWTVPMILVDC